MLKAEFMGKSKIVRFHSKWTTELYKRNKDCHIFLGGNEAENQSIFFKFVTPTSVS
jgi:hypothetical protein